MAASDDEIEWEEEENTVVVELNGVIENDFFANMKGNCKVLGIDSEQPYLQLDNYTFSGEYEDVPGTCLLFEEKTPPGSSAESERRDESKRVPDLEYHGKTHKKLVMNRVFFTNKQETPETTDDGQEVIHIGDEENSDGTQTMDTDSEPVASTSHQKQSVTDYEEKT